MSNNNVRPQHLQQEQLPESLSFDDECIAAQRAAYESILIGRETAAVVQQQGEQLHRAETIADSTQYQLDRATRLLKGMTWSGWVNNMFTALPSSLPSPTNTTSTSTAAKNLPNSTMPSLGNKYDAFPSTCHDIVQAIQNYHANVTILQCCETVEQKQTCLQICNVMYTDATTKLQQSSSSQLEAYIMELKHDLEKIRKHQVLLQSQVILNPASASNSTMQQQEELDERERNELFGPTRSGSSDQKSPPHKGTAATPSPKKSILEQKQDEHLHILASSLNELGTIAQSLNAGLHDQNHSIESLDTKSDLLHETSKMVTRRTNRIIQNKSSWMMPSTASQSLKKSTFFGTVMIRHVTSGKYLSVMGTDLYLVNQYNTISCTYDIYLRSGNTIGIKSHANHKWIGQSFLTGSITCAAATFGKREELETDHSSTWMSPDASTTTTTTGSNVADAPPNITTRLLCVSAGWGQGGYIQINSDENYSIQITGITLEDSKNAAQWSMIRIE